MFELVTLLGAEIEIQTAYIHLSESNFQRAEKFDANLQAAFHQLKTFPHSGPVYSGRIHRLVLSPGPYALFYAFDKTRVYIHAFLDTRQQPEMIARRLGI